MTRAGFIRFLATAVTRRWITLPEAGALLARFEAGEITADQLPLSRTEALTDVTDEAIKQAVKQLQDRSAEYDDRAGTQD